MAIAQPSSLNGRRHDSGVRRRDAPAGGLAGDLRHHHTKGRMLAQGVCGCCTILLDGKPSLSCQLDPQQASGREVVTLEGLPDRQRQLLAEAFVQEGAVQCGFCTPGIAVRAAHLLNNDLTRDRTRVERASLDTSAAAPATTGSSTQSRPPARRGAGMAGFHPRTTTAPTTFLAKSTA